MARQARKTNPENEGWFHICSTVAGRRDEQPLLERGATRQLIEMIEHFSSIYFCKIASFCILGNEYKLVVNVPRKKRVNRKELRQRSRLMYPDNKKQAEIGQWQAEQWDHYRGRLFDVSEYMRNLQAAYGRWYNRSYDRRGGFWAGRFESVLLENEEVALDCMLYLETSPVRVKMSKRPEKWPGSSFHLRDGAKADWMFPLTSLINQPNAETALAEFRQRLYYRADLAPKRGQGRIPPEIIESEIERGFKEPGMNLQSQQYWSDGIAVGSKEFITERIALMREDSRYLRRKNPIQQLGGIHYSLREQRGTKIIF